jgi:hypothetical protein
MWRRYGDALYTLLTLAIFGFETIALGTLSLAFLLGAAGIASTPIEEILLAVVTSTASALAEVPVVILSADARPTLVDQLLAQGARAFLTKPLDVRELLELLDAVAGDRDSRQGVR